MAQVAIQLGARRERHKYVQSNWSLKTPVNTCLRTNLQRSPGFRHICRENKETRDEKFVENPTVRQKSLDREKQTLVRAKIRSRSRFRIWNRSKKDRGRNLEKDKAGVH